MTRFSATEVQRILNQEGYSVKRDDLESQNNDSGSSLSVLDAKKMVQPGEHIVIRPKTKAKYRNVKVVYHCYKRGILVFDSTGEFKRYKELLMLEQAGEIRDLDLQVPFELLPSFVLPDGESVRGVTYRADFTYTVGELGVIEDFKGMETEVFKLKWKMMQYTYGKLYNLILT